MTASDAAPGRRTRYLLGLASEEEREAMEAEFFENDESFERLHAAEDELFDSYTAGRMTAAESAAFHRRYLSSPEGRQRLTFARALQERADQASAEPGAEPARAGRRVVAWVGWAAAIVAMAVAGWLVAQNARLRGEIEDLRRQARSSPPPASPRPVDGTPNPETRPATVLSLRLPARPSRAPLDVALATETRTLRLEVGLNEGEDSATFDVVIRRPEGKEVWREEGLAPREFGAPIVVMVPADALPGDEYVLSLEGEPSREGSARRRREYHLRLKR
jgi:hypothetical protein